MVLKHSERLVAFKMAIECYIDNSRADNVLDTTCARIFFGFGTTGLESEKTTGSNPPNSIGSPGLR
jgi:hypothetical protein